MLQVITREQAVACVREQFQTLTPRTEAVGLRAALRRILAQDIVAAQDLPPFDRSTVDGYAVCAADTFGAGAAIPAELTVVGDIAMGEAPAFRLQRGQCARIATGGLLPQGADAAVMVEHTEETDGCCLVYAGVSPLANVTRRGDDLAAGATALQKGALLGPREIGILAALGVYDVPVFQPLRAAVISTGDELVTGTPQNGQMRDVNSFLLCAALEACGCEAQFCGAVKDDKAAIGAALDRAVETAELVLLSGGSSAGTRDLTLKILEARGEVLFHGIAMKPGKPTLFGMARGKPVFGLPGHPLAAYFVFRLVVREALRSLYGLPPEPPLGKAPLAVNLPSNHGREEFLCVKKQPDGTLLPLHTKSGVLSALTAADGIIRVPRNAEGLAKGTEVTYDRV